MDVINVRMLSHPINWLVVWTVLAFAGLAWAIVHEGLQNVPLAHNADHP